jgi:hypothetical protein
MSAVHRAPPYPSGFPLNIEAGEDKIRKYLLNVDHREGGPKAKFFLARGFTILNWQALAEALRFHPADNPIEEEQVTVHGKKITVRCMLRTPDGNATCIRTVWMTEDGVTARLVTAYPR